MAPRSRWIFLGGRGDQQPADEYNHGSCVLAQIASPRFGTAKNANVVIVKMPWYGSVELDTSVSEFDFLHGLVAILNDVREKNLQGKAVLNISWACKYKVLKRSSLSSIY